MLGGRGAGLTSATSVRVVDRMGIRGLGGDVAKAELLRYGQKEYSRGYAACRSKMSRELQDLERDNGHLKFEVARLTAALDSRADAPAPPAVPGIASTSTQPNPTSAVDDTAPEDITTPRPAGPSAGTAEQSGQGAGDETGEPPAKRKRRANRRSKRDPRERAQELVGSSMLEGLAGQEVGELVRSGRAVLVDLGGHHAEGRRCVVSLGAPVPIKRVVSGG